jgi:hypothetical protein
MSFANMPPQLKPDWPNNKSAQDAIMAKWEIKKRFGVSEALWWKFVQGPEIVVKWPNGWTVMHENSDGSIVSTESADPNDHYRPWLEKNVGSQGWDWNWKHSIGASTYTPGYESEMMASDRVVIKFRKKHKEAALMAKLLWT